MIFDSDEVLLNPVLIISKFYPSFVVDWLSSGDKIRLYLPELCGLLDLFDSDDKNLLRSCVRRSPFVEFETECLA
jgi:hypothetical protein